MSKVKSDKVPHYELLYIISNKYTDEEIKPIGEKVISVIEQNGGNVTLKDEWGKKKFAYPIGQFAFGYYNLVEFDAPGEGLVKINQVLSMESEILRYQLISKHVRTAAEIEKAEEISKKIASKAQAKERVEEEKKKGKVDMKELDERLDRILETDDLL